MSERTFLLPDLGEGLVDAKVLDWLAAVGDTVERGDPLVEVETTKSAVEIPAPWAGRIVALHAAPDEQVDVGRPLVTIAVEEPAETASPTEEPGAPAPSPGIVGTVPSDERPRRRVRLTPPTED